MLLQRFIKRKPRQAEKSQKWQCGRLQQGRPCPMGPNLSGKCQQAHECIPQQVNGQWMCRRPKEYGPPCKNGPLANGKCCKAITPCKPTLTLSAKRNAFAVWTSVFVVGLIFFIVGSSYDMKMLMPGPLTTVHSAIDNCANCHSNISGNQFSWLPAVFASTKPQEDSKACISCHKMKDESAMQAHGVVKTKIEAITTEFTGKANNSSASMINAVSNTVFPVESTFPKGVYCATCHKEHMDKSIQLTDVSDSQCQTCHAVQFSDFKSNHPEYDGYPFQRRTRLKFDHMSHFNKHFPEELKKGLKKDKIPGECAYCHQPVVNKKHMAVKSFKETCSACHLDQILGKERATGPKGIALLALPGLDVETLKEKNIQIGEWPVESEAEITPMMKLLIGGDASRQALLKSIEELDLLDLTSANGAQLQSVQQLAWEIKLLFYELTLKKSANFVKRLGLEPGSNFDPNLIANLTASIPRDVLLNAQREWLPNLKSEITQNAALLSRLSTPPDDGKDGGETLPWTQKQEVKPVEQPKKVPEPPKVEQTQKPVQKVEPEKVVPQKQPEPQPQQEQKPAVEDEGPIDPNQTDDLLLEKLPTDGKTTSLPVQKDIKKANYTHKTSSREFAGLSNDIAFPSDLLKDIKTLIGEDHFSVHSSRQIKGLVRLAQNASEKDGYTIDIFGNLVKKKPEDDEQGDIPLAKDKPAAPKAEETTEPAKKPAETVEQKVEPVKDVEPKPEPKPQPKKVVSPPPQPEIPKVKAQPAPELVVAVDAESWADTGGWYRQDYGILYRPTGHKDLFIRAWLDFSGSVFGKTNSKAAPEVFELLTHKDAQGQCNKCHSVDGTKSVDAQKSEVRYVNWAPSMPEDKKGRFTTFAHEPHFGILGTDGCLSCHTVKEGSKPREKYKGLDPSVFDSNFNQVKKEQCDTCHKPNAVRDDCQLCHKYHVNGVVSPIMTTRLPNQQ